MYSPHNVELPPSFDDIKNINSHPFLSYNLPLFRGSFLRESTKEEVKKFIALCRKKHLTFCFGYV